MKKIDTTQVYRFLDDETRAKIKSLKKSKYSRPIGQCDDDGFDLSQTFLQAVMTAERPARLSIIAIVDTFWAIKAGLAGYGLNVSDDAIMRGVELALEHERYLRDTEE